MHETSRGRGAALPVARLRVSALRRDLRMDWRANPYGLLGLSATSHLGSAVSSFIYDVPKVLPLLTAI